MSKWMIAVLLVAMISCAAGLWGGETRPVRDDVGFCWKTEQINQLMAYLKGLETDPDEGVPPLVAGISPHDDFLYAGRVYYPVMSRIKTGEAVIFGVTHSSVRKIVGDIQNKIILDEYETWSGPLSPAAISPLREIIREKMDKNNVMVSNEAHKLEHSIEAMIPMLQYFNPGVRITPIMITAMNFEQMERLTGELAGIISQYMRERNLTPGKDVFFLISADANHYGEDFSNVIFGLDDRAHHLGTEQDKDIARSCLSGMITTEKIRGLTARLWGKTFRDNGAVLWCGKYSIPFGLLTVMKTLRGLGAEKELNGRILRYSDTYSEGVLPLKKSGYGITAPFSLKHWVGFFSAGFYY